MCLIISLICNNGKHNYWFLLQKTQIHSEPVFFKNWTCRMLNIVSNFDWLNYMPKPHYISNKRTINRQHVCVLDVNKFRKFKNMGWFQEYTLSLYPLRHWVNRSFRWLRWDMKSHRSCTFQTTNLILVHCSPSIINFTTIRTIQ